MTGVVAADVTGIVAADGAVGVDLDSPADEAWRQCADVLYGSRPRPGAEARALALWALRHYPGCLLAVIRRDDGCCLTASVSAPGSVSLPGPDSPPGPVTASVSDSTPGPDPVPASASVTASASVPVTLGRRAALGTWPPGSVPGLHEVVARLVASLAPSPGVTPRDGRRAGAVAPPDAARPPR
ncbi:hypothetical protein [Streptomyces sp. NPDC014734]|uniref:hypothetical protein n=1 Tax=Streptomyces sp. NPDC014734 TaxID=3364886 RepID=UPI0036FE6C3F